MSNSISRFPGTEKQLLFSHRDRASQWVAATLGLITMACPCSKLLAESPLPTPGGEVSVGYKTTKDSSLLDNFINHYSILGEVPPTALSTDMTHLVFAMNYENEQGEIKNENSAESEGAAEPPQQQSLIEISLPLMTHSQISNIIQGMNTGLNINTTNVMLESIPETPPVHGQTIANMIQHLIETLNINVNEVQNGLISALYDIHGSESPVDITKPQQEQSLAMLIVSYYTALNSNGTSPQTTQVFFSSFLLHAVGLSGIGRLHAKKGDLLGVKEPIEDSEVLKANVKESTAVFSALKLLEEARRDFLLQLDNYSEVESTNALLDPMLKAAISLLNYRVEKNGIPLYKRNKNSHERMLKLIGAHGESNPKLVAWNSQFMTLIHAISMLLDPFVMQFANTHVDNLSSYFSALKWDHPVTDSEGKERSIFEVFKEVLDDAEVNPGNENPELFKKLLHALREYIEKELQKAFTEDEFKVVMVTLGTGFADLLEQSNDMLEIFDKQIAGAKDDKAAEGQEGQKLSEEEKKRKHLGQRINYLQDFVMWLRSNYDFDMTSSYDSYNDDSHVENSQNNDADRSSNDVDRNSNDADGSSNDADRSSNGDERGSPEGS
ncbi:hypothetical protein [Endozoicomonas sp. 8E]|uniref:hypothetical protein n=1 Tax=Endozoicomonas sp. 8E TaxID=3035692 RepID=UPI002939076C|nr:hypothetical protein [Endozoicomonas sp. 8E]WOG28211.1 hypothetical protein P6910_00760 [Endozoicomonas sp. 8E]